MFNGIKITLPSAYSVDTKYSNCISGYIDDLTEHEADYLASFMFTLQKFGWTVGPIKAIALNSDKFSVSVWVPRT